MGKITICDFCERSKFLGARLKVRGKRLGFLPRMLGHATYDIILCDECYYGMQEYISKEVVKNARRKTRRNT